MTPVFFPNFPRVRARSWSNYEQNWLEAPKFLGFIFLKVTKWFDLGISSKLYEIAVSSPPPRQIWPEYWRVGLGVWCGILSHIELTIIYCFSRSNALLDDPDHLRTKFVGLFADAGQSIFALTSLWINLSNLSFIMITCPYWRSPLGVEYLVSQPWLAAHRQF